MPIVVWHVSPLSLHFLAGFQETLGVWMQTPGGRLLLLLGLLALLLVSVLLVLVPLSRRSSSLLLHALAVRLEGIRLGIPATLPQRQGSAEARGLLESVNRLVDDAAGREQELRRKIGELEGLLETPRDVAILATDGEGRIGYFGRGASALLGYSASEVSGRSVEFLFPDASWRELLPRLARRSFREEGVRVDSVMMRRDRREIPVTLSIGPGPASGEPHRFVAVIQDARDSRTLGDRLRHAEELLGILLEAVPDAVLILKEGRIVQANSRSESLFGVRRSDLVGRSFKETLVSEDLLSGLHQTGAALSQEDPVEFSAGLLAAGRERPPFRARIRLIRFATGAGFSLLATLREETPGGGTPGDSDAARRLLDAALDSASEGILVQESADSGSDFVLVNRRLEEFLGVPGREILSWSEARLVRELIDRGASQEIAGGLASLAAEGGQPLLLDLTSPTARSLEVHGGALRGGAGLDQGRVLMFRDVTAAREAERALREGHAALAASRQRLEETVAALEAAKVDLAARNEQLERLNCELRSLDEMKSGLLANVSHELQTPLVLIKGYTEMILKRKIGPLTPEQEKGLGVALRNIDRLVEMIDNLLDFSRMERGESPLDLEEFPLWQVIDEVVDLMRGKLESAGVLLTTEYETDDLMVRADRGKIAQVFINLLSNAIKFNREGGRIEIRVSAPESGKLSVEIRDTGIGMPPKELEKIFERFYQVESSPQRRSEGTGIGLSIVKEILALHQCGIRVESTEGEGSRFTFTLPRGRTPSPPRLRGSQREGHPLPR